MSNQLKNGSYECMICTETIRHQVATWACTECFRVFHLFCVKKWAKSDGSGEGASFRCPSCQHQYANCPNKYLCFCGKRRDPQPDGFVTPHTCGDTCGRRRGNGCPHPCTLQCHPGPCLDCTQAAAPKRCPCGSTEYSYQCGRPDPKTTCEARCGKLLSCGNHRCERQCHHGPCGDCTKVVEVRCKCGNEGREMPCGTPAFQCDKPCGKTQRCGKHQCPVMCHDGECPPCDTDPSVVFTCHCGKDPLEYERFKCTEPVPSCGKVCGKVLLCGRHECKRMCHPGACPPCDARENSHCLCGSTQQKMTCAEAEVFRCNRKCKAKLSCGRHECAVLCCPHRRSADPMVHQCTRVCGKKLDCEHTCPECCHRGACPPCVNIVTEELSCACGAVVLEPPQPCGTKPPECSRTCTRALECGHDPLPHNCHFGPCPPCTKKVDRTCIGGHTTVRAVMCSSGPVSCGNTCNKPLECGHGCPQRCHGGPCVDPERPRRCTQPCGKQLACGHPCKAKCHAGRSDTCPACTSKEEVPCECGLSKIQMPCAEFQALAAAAAPGQGVVAKCIADCDYQRRLSALGSIGGGGGDGGDRFASLAPSAGGGPGSRPSTTLYSFNLWDIAARGMEPIVAAERHLGTFVRKQEKNGLLPSMSRDRRAVVHELAQYYHVETEAVDREPNRTICLTRHVHSRIPTRLLSEVVTDPSSNPEAVCQRALATKASASKSVIVFEGLPEVVTEQSVFRILKFVSGTFVLVERSHFRLVFPDGKVPAPAQSHKGEESIAILAVFGRPSDASAAFSSVRKNGCSVTFHWYGEGPPPTNFSNRELGIKGMAPVAARWFCDDASTSTAPQAQRRPHSAALPQPGSSSWASVARRDTARQKQAARPTQVDTGNKFGALRR